MKVQNRAKEKAITTKDTTENTSDARNYGGERRDALSTPGRRPALPLYLNTSIEISVSNLNCSVPTS